MDSVVYTSCNLGALINSAGWEQWSTATPNTANVEFAEFDSTGELNTTYHMNRAHPHINDTLIFCFVGAGAAGTRASFSKKLTSNAGFTAADVLGSTWTTWVDQAYV